jgi:hypothetical protein
MKGTYQGVVSGFCEQVETNASLNTSGTSATLCSIAFGDVRFNEATNLPFLIESKSITTYQQIRI